MDIERDTITIAERTTPNGEYRVWHRGVPVEGYPWVEEAATAVLDFLAQAEHYLLVGAPTPKLHPVKVKSTVRILLARAYGYITITADAYVTAVIDRPTTPALVQRLKSLIHQAAEATKGGPTFDEFIAGLIDNLQE